MNEAVRSIDSFPRPMLDRRLLVVAPDKASSRLEMLDLACISVKWIESLAPGFRDSEVARDLIKRELLNPD